MNKTIISISGFGYSGSGAVKDLLSEFDEISIPSSFEFQILYFPDGISDLDYHLNISFSRFYDSDLAINRFLNLCKKMDVDYESTFHGHLYEIAYRYIKKITSLEWYSYWTYDRLGIPLSHYKEIERINNKIYKKNYIISQCNRILRKIKFPLISYISYKELFKKRRMFLAIRPANFIKETKSFINELLSYVENDKPFVVYDQFLPPNNSSYFYKYFENIKSIVVLRDPRDTWIFSKLKKISFIPHTDVNDFIIWYRENNKKEAQLSNDGVLIIHFEDIIYDYEVTLNKIVNYLGISNHTRKMELFSPDISINNTQLYLKYPQYIDEVNIIEKQLSEYLYDYDKYTLKPKFNINIF